MKRYTFPAVVILLLLGFAVWWLSPSQVLKRQTNRLFDTLTLSAGSGPPARQIKGLTLNKLLAEQVRLRHDTIEEVNGTFSRQDIEGGFSWLAGSARRTEFHVVTFENVSIEQHRGIVNAVVEGLVELPNYRPADGRYAVTLEWQEAEDGWRVDAIHWGGER